MWRQVPRQASCRALRSSQVPARLGCRPRRRCPPRRANTTDPCRTQCEPFILKRYERLPPSLGSGSRPRPPGAAPRSPRAAPKHDRPQREAICGRAHESLGRWFRSRTRWCGTSSRQARVRTIAVTPSNISSSSPTADTAPTNRSMIPCASHPPEKQRPRQGSRATLRHGAFSQRCLGSAGVSESSRARPAECQCEGSAFHTATPAARPNRSRNTPPPDWARQ